MKKVLAILTTIVLLALCFVSCEQGGTQDQTPEHTHSFGEWSITKNATCTEDGVKTRYCSCGENQSDSIPAIGHNYVEDECANCGDVKETSECKHKNLAVISGKDSNCFDIFEIASAV